MSDAPDKESKTEEPSAKKLEDSRKKGDVVKSQELTTWFMLGGSALMIAIMAPGVARNLSGTFKTILANADQFVIGSSELGGFLWGLFISVILVAIVPLVILSLCAIVANLVQHRPLMSTEPITPKLQKISPLAGAKRLFSVEALVNFAKGIAKIGIVSAVMAVVLWPERDRLDTMMTIEPSMILVQFYDLALKVFWAVLAVITVVAMADFAYQRQKWWNKQKMTVQEVKDEYKQMEGDPQVKGRIRQLRNERGRHRMMAAVPEATVVITNPTHFAVALKYDRDMAAPRCVAKGADAVALRIRKLARENDVPIVENPSLARALFASVDVDEVIPGEHFKAVAQVIGYVMRLKDKSSWRSG